MTSTEANLQRRTKILRTLTTCAALLIPAIAQGQDGGAAENLDQVLSDARCVPEFEKGKQVGYRCFDIQPGSVYAKMGLRNNDVICGFDGKPAIDPKQTFEKIGEISAAQKGSFKICVKRGGKKLEQIYEAKAQQPKGPPSSKHDSTKQVKK